MRIRLLWLWVQVTALLGFLPGLALYPPPPSRSWWWQVAIGVVVASIVATLTLLTPTTPAAPVETERPERRPLLDPATTDALTRIAAAMEAHTPEVPYSIPDDGRHLTTDDPTPRARRATPP